MELAEPIDWINEQLKREFGLELDGRPRWRVASADQIEKRIMTHTDEGIELLHPEVREVPKYCYIDRFMYVLERLVPVTGETDIITKMSYEPAYTFQTKQGKYLPPRYEVAKFVIESIYAQMDKAGTHVKYKDPHASKEARLQMVKDMEEKLFGNETPVGDALAHKYGVAGFHTKFDFSMEKTQ